MPWRRTKDPYAIWVSEVMLQQTQVSVVIPYYERWMTRFPSVGSLASASEEEVLTLWQGLGYYRRAKGLIAGARFVLDRGMPTNPAEWQRVPGVGAYTAGAISSIAQGQPSALVDGNVERVYCRLTGDRSVGPERSKNAWRWAEANVCEENPGDWNQGLMELGATICTPREPNCAGCPLQLDCTAFLKGIVSQLPTESPKPQVKPITMTLWLLTYDDCLHIRTASEGEWWAGMRVLPEGDLEVDGWVEDLGRFKFTVTTHRVTADVKLVRLHAPRSDFETVPVTKLKDIPIPAPHRKAIGLLHKI